MYVVCGKTPSSRPRGTRDLLFNFLSYAYRPRAVFHRKSLSASNLPTIRRIGPGNGEVVRRC